MNQLYACAIEGDTFFFLADITDNQISEVEKIIASFPVSSAMDNRELFSDMLQRINSDTAIRVSPITIQYVFRNYR